MNLTKPQREVLESVAQGTPSGRKDVFVRLHDAGLIDLADGGDGPWFITKKGQKALQGSADAEARMATDQMGSPYKSE